MDRKYRQQGYQDRPRPDQPSGPRGGGGFVDDRPTRMEGAPRGRGAERDREEVFRCKVCGERADPEVKLDSACKKCGAALHACVQCAHFDTVARYQCRKPIPVAIPAKSKANDCALYEPTRQLDLRGKSSVDTPDQARAAFDKLFGKR
jgi:hypothetical protein